MKEKLLEVFARIYKGCSLYAIQLDGFTHRVFWKDENGERHIDRRSSCCPEEYSETKKYQDGTWRSFNEDKTKVLFIGCPHYCYQNNAEEYTYKDLKEW